MTCMDSYDTSTKHTKYISRQHLQSAVVRAALCTKILKILLPDVSFISTLL